jgi:hypothetical protein
VLCAVQHTHRTPQEWLWGVEDPLLKLLGLPATVSLATNMTSEDDALNGKFTSLHYTGKGNIDNIARYIDYCGSSPSPSLSRARVVWRVRVCVSSLIVACAQASASIPRERCGPRTKRSMALRACSSARLWVQYYLLLCASSPPPHLRSLSIRSRLATHTPLMQTGTTS